MEPQFVQRPSIDFVIEVFCQLDPVEVTNRAPRAPGHTEQPDFDENKDASPNAQNQTACYRQKDKNEVARPKDRGLLAWVVYDITKTCEICDNMAGNAKAQDVPTDCTAPKHLVDDKNGHRKDERPADCGENPRDKDHRQSSLVLLMFIFGVAQNGAGRRNEPVRSFGESSLIHAT